MAPGQTLFCPPFVVLMGGQSECNTGREWDKKLLEIVMLRMEVFSPGGDLAKLFFFLFPSN